MYPADKRTSEQAEEEYLAADNAQMKVHTEELQARAALWRRLDALIGLLEPLIIAACNKAREELNDKPGR